MSQKTKNKKIRTGLFVTIFIVALQIIGAQSAFALSISSFEIIALTNSSREEVGLPALLVNDKLSEAAEKKAQDMFANQYFDHNSPQGLTPWDFIKSAGYEYKYAGENLAIDFISADGAHRALMDSSSHRENILNSNYNQIGVAVIEDTFEGNLSIMIVEEFGSPLVNEEIWQVKSLREVEETMEVKVKEINERREKDFENLQIKSKNVGASNFSEQSKKGEILNSVDDNKKEQRDKIQSDEQNFFQAEVNKISAQVGLFQKKEINFSTNTRDKIFKKVVFDADSRKKTTCQMLSVETFDNKLALASDNNMKPEFFMENPSQIVKSFQNYAHDGLLTILTLLYATVNVLVVYKFFL